MSKAVVTDDLRTRCAEILEWKKTGILTGGALRSCARKINERLGLSSDMGQALAMAESETAREAMEAALSHGAEAVEPEQKPVAWRVYAGGRYDVYADPVVADARAHSLRSSVEPLFASPVRSAQEAVKVDVDALAQEIRRVDGNHPLGAGALAEALVPFIDALLPPGGETATPPPPVSISDWQAQDLVPGQAYESINFGTVTYLGIDNFYGDKTHAFDVGRQQRRYWKTEKLGEFLQPKATPAPVPTERVSTTPEKQQ